MAAVAWCWQAGKEAASHFFHKALDGFKWLYFLMCQYVGLKPAAKLGDVCFRFTVPQLQTFSIWEIPSVLHFVTNCYLPSSTLCRTWFLSVPHYGLPGPPQQFCLTRLTEILASCVCCPDGSFYPVLLRYQLMAFWTLLVHRRNKYGFKTYCWHDCQW